VRNAASARGPRVRRARRASATSGLRAKLREAQQTLEAIRSGHVDALVVRSPGGERVFALETADRPYRMLVEQMAQGAAALSHDGLVVYANPRLHALLDMPDDALAGLPFDSLFPEERREEMAWLVAQARLVPCTLECRMKVAGQSVPVRVSASPLGLPEMAVVALVTDLTTEARNAALEETRDLLQRADRAKDHFLSMLAHELRNPLAPIRNSVSLLRGKLPPGSELASGIDMISRQVDSMALLLDDLLDVSQLTRGGLALRREPVTLQDVVELAVETSAPVIAAAGHELTVSLTDEPLPLLADAIRLSQAIANVLNNAAKYTERGGRISVEARGVDDASAELVVRDTGIGISAEALPRVFDVFSPAKPAFERAQGGLGIGLSLVRGLVELHGGTIEAASRGLGQGSEFLIRLPLADGAGQAPARETPAPGAMPAPLRILVADDNRDSAESLALLLAAMGHEVRTELDGERAVEAAEAFRPQVVLLDLGMPRLDGYEAARRIRALPGGRDVVLIAQTGWSQPEDRRRSQEAGFDYHVVKPIPSGSLEKLLAHSRPAAPPASH
jgi:PAS domain S-box-containing protein